jgi:peptide/nickel transport system substrate-binding protein
MFRIKALSTAFVAVSMLTLPILTLPVTEALAQQRDRLVLAMGLEPPMLDPTANAAAAIKEVTYINLFEGLARVDESGRIQPSLAESWSVSPDGLTYTFRLRSGVTFQDGAPFSSADVKFSFERAAAPESTNGQKAFFQRIASIETPDPATAIITLKQRDGLFLWVVAQGDGVILSPRSAADAKTNPVGTGPFRFIRWVKGDRVELAKWDGYRDAKAIALKTIVFRFIGDPSAQVAAMLAGDIDAFPNIGPAESIEQFKADPRFAVVIGATEGETVLATNNKKKPFDQIKVRQAIAHAIDRKALIDGVLFGYGVPIGSHFSPLHPAYVDLTGTYPLDLVKARALLTEAGYPDGFSATLKLPPPVYARRGGEIIAQQLGAIGIKLTIEPVQWAQWLSGVFKERDYDLSIVSHTEPLDIDIYTRDNYYFNYDNPAFKDLLREISATQDEAARNELYKKAEILIARDAVNGFLFQLPKLGVWNKDIEGLWQNSPVQANDVTKVRWKK